MLGLTLPTASPALPVLLEAARKATGLAGQRYSSSRIP
jgi:hypothetical protein